MSDVSGDLWLRFGTSVVWDANALLLAASRGMTVSLREALAWADAIPDEPPEGVRTVVVTGLQTAVEVLRPEEVVMVLHRVQRLVRAHSRAWGEAAVIFAAEDRTRFRVNSSSGALLLKLPSSSEIEFGAALWGGAATEASRIVEQRTDAKGREMTVELGYWLRRVS